MSVLTGCTEDADPMDGKLKCPQGKTGARLREGRGEGETERSAGDRGVSKGT